MYILTSDPTLTVRKLSTAVSTPVDDTHTHTLLMSDWMDPRVSLLVGFFINMCLCAHTLELVPGIKDAHVRRYGVKSTTSYDVHAFVSCLAAVVQLHALQKLCTAREKHTLTHKFQQICGERPVFVLGNSWQWWYILCNLKNNLYKNLLTSC